MKTDLKIIKLKDGRDYTVRLDRTRFFYPQEWINFFKSLRENKKPLFDFMFNTGARFNEATHIRPCDFDFERNNVRLWKTKTKAKKGETHGKPRTISLSSEYSKRVKKHCSNFQNEDFIFRSDVASFNSMIKRKLEKLGVEDYYNLSSHNIRKTHGMYLKAVGFDIAEICVRLGHDYNTYIKHYGSADVFSDRDIIQIKELLGDLIDRRRRF